MTKISFVILINVSREGLPESTLGIPYTSLLTTSMRNSLKCFNTSIRHKQTFKVMLVSEIYKKNKEYRRTQKKYRIREEPLIFEV